MAVVCGFGALSDASLEVIDLWLLGFKLFSNFSSVCRKRNIFFGFLGNRVAFDFLLEVDLSFLSNKTTADFEIFMYNQVYIY